MAYIGKTPVIGNFQVCDAISVVNNQAAYTMQVGGVNVSPESANHMLVSLNGILQAPTNSFTVSGSTITFASNLVTGDVIDFIQILGNVLDLGVPSDSTVSLAKLTATGTKDATTFLRGDNTFAAAGGVDTIFNVVKNVDQSSISDGTLTKITNWTADVDTGSGWDNTNHKFVIPTGKGGKYLIGATITQSQSGGGNSIADTYDIMIFKNGSVVFTNCDKNRPALDWCTSHITTILDLAAADELEIYTKVTAGGGSTTVREHSDYQTSNRCTNWYGCKLA
jgi:hypothetical protein